MNRSLAQKLRSNPTEAEKRMWRLLFPLRTGGFHFRKQVPIRSYVADFACHHAKLVIEVDGGQHYGEPGQANDAARDAYLEQRGYFVLRFSNLDILTNPDGVYFLVSERLRHVEPRLRKAAH